jgi:hypothetical protein
MLRAIRVLSSSSSSSHTRRFVHSPKIKPPAHVLGFALLCFAPLFRKCNKPRAHVLGLPRFFSKIARARTTWCGALLSSLRAFLKIISAFIPCSGLFIMPHRTMSKIGDLRAHGVVLFSSSLSTFLEKKTFRVRPMFCALLPSRYISSKTETARTSCFVLSSLSQKRLTLQAHVCAFRAGRMRSKSTVDDYMFSLCEK